MFIETPASAISLSGRKPIYGIGINDSEYITQTKINNKVVICPFYRKWKNMIQRCYSLRFQEKYPTYIGCSVCDDWLIFSNFKSWMIKQDWQDKHLDKDILFYGNKIYSHERCLFVSEEINNLLGSKSNNKTFPTGVSLCRRKNKYVAKCNESGDQNYIGSFDTVEQASDAYINHKSKLIRSTALNQSEPLKSALIRIAKKLLNKEGK